MQHTVASVAPACGIRVGPVGLMNRNAQLSRDLRQRAGWYQLFSRVAEEQISYLARVTARGHVERGTGRDVVIAFRGETS